MSSDRGVRVTQRVPLAEVEALLTRPARAALAYAGPHGPECVPVLVRRDGGVHVGLRREAVPAAGLPERVTLVADEGSFWFQLRAGVWRGSVTPEGGGPAGADGLVWFRLDPRRAVAWDYARLHEEPV